MPQNFSPVAIVGAGPTGIACAVELGRRGIAAICYDSGSILDSLYHFPEEMRWFSTRDLLDIAGVPFPAPEAHPTRLEALAYYRGIAERFGVRVAPESRVHSIRPGEPEALGARPPNVLLRAGDSLAASGMLDKPLVRRSSATPPRGLSALPLSLRPRRARDGQYSDRLLVLTVVGREGPREVTSPAAILATGFFHNPRKLRVPGEELPHVHARYVSGYPFHGRDVAVVGSRNSAAEAALDLYRHGARVTLLARGPAISDRVKYWIKPDLENRIRAEAIRALFNTRVLEITPDAVRVATPEGEESVPAEAVFALIGYEPDFAFLTRCGVHLEGPQSVPSHDPETLESNVPNLYLAGAILGGTEIGKIFIENSRHHAAIAASSIERRRGLVPA